MVFGARYCSPRRSGGVGLAPRKRAPFGENPAPSREPLAASRNWRVCGVLFTQTTQARCILKCHLRRREKRTPVRVVRYESANVTRYAEEWGRAREPGRAFRSPSVVHSMSDKGAMSMERAAGAPPSSRRPAGQFWVFGFAPENFAAGALTRHSPRPAASILPRLRRYPPGKSPLGPGLPQPLPFPYAVLVGYLAPSSPPHPANDSG